MISPAIRLADWLCSNTPARPDALTHLKLEKLAFYSYGALLALDLDGELGDVQFQAWKHGPVAPKINSKYGSFKGGEALPFVEYPHEPFSERAAAAMRDVINVYGRLTGWQLREESHLERPWCEHFDGALNKEIPKEDLRRHFKKKFASPGVRFPERLFGASSLLLDRIPVPTFRSLSEMSMAATRILGEEA